MGCWACVYLPLVNSIVNKVSNKTYTSPVNTSFAVLGEGLDSGRPGHW